MGDRAVDCRTCVTLAHIVASKSLEPVSRRTIAFFARRQASSTPVPKYKYLARYPGWWIVKRTLRWDMTL